MSKRLILILSFAFILGLLSLAYAEVQNIKVGGDILLRGLSRNNFDLVNSGTPGDKEDDQASFATANVRLRIDADLTDNVSATVRLLNERLWGTLDDTTATSDIDLDLAYVTLKEFLYSPLTVTLGRQELRYGNALIVGDPDTNRVVDDVSPFSGTIAADLSSHKAFDAIRAVLNYDPLVLDLFYAKIEEDTLTRNDDVDLMGVNLIYTLDKNTTLNPYLFIRSEGSNRSGQPGKSTKAYVPGILVTSSPIENLKGSLEFAYQFGRDTASANKLRAWAAQGSLDYTLAKVAYSPMIGLQYTYLSGDKNTSDNKDKAWDPMFEDQTLNSIPNLLFVNSNMQVINLKGSLKPMEDLTILANYGNYRLAQKVTSLSGYTNWTLTGKKDLGDALDIEAIYDYTEDVQLGLCLGWFFPGKAFDKSQGRRTANQVIGSMKVTF
ncbi:MAG: alginate export family protein [Candidatus Omnitrophica bacterium]|nr:alginate export family protein [Candidatus Omnitrophota bacterium]MCM8800062.1 alginate export family protein [Candidatus Omnitrophota bacterium]